MTERDPGQLGALAKCMVSVTGLLSDTSIVVQSLYDQGARVIDTRTERVVKLEDGPTFGETVNAWWTVKKESLAPATVTSDSSEVTVDVKPEALLVAAFAGAGRPLHRVEAVRAAAGWHNDYVATEAEWEPWREALRDLIYRRRVVQVRGLGPGGAVRWTLSAGETP